MTIQLKRLAQKEVNHEELTSLLALTLLYNDFTDNAPSNTTPGSEWLRWGDATAAGEKNKVQEDSSN